MSDLIIALATPLGRSGIAVIRLSGDSALTIAASLARTEHNRFVPRQATLRKLIDPATSEVLDEAVITYFRGPNSFTGEDIVEISCHGSPIVLRQVIDECLAAGARMAEPGEFSLRALANGRMNLAEAEAIRDLIDAQSVGAARQAVRQMEGEFSHELHPLKSDLLDVIVVLESALEFVEDDLPETQRSSIVEKLKEVRSAITAKAETYKAGRLLRDGLRVALVGRPNVGKSSLFNALLGSDRAIVTDIAGTTRDQLHERFTIDGIPISLIDTAGLRETSDQIESIGVERSRRALTDADLVLLLLDATEPLSDEDQQIISTTEGLRRIFVLNKIDKADSAAILRMRSELEYLGVAASEISAKTGEGIAQLQQAILEPFQDGHAEDSGFMVTDARHHDLLQRSSDEITGSIDLLASGASEEIVLIGLHNALRYLGEITGETTTEDMLSQIFATFCIGK
jgi:tRNA modification GTPase